MFLHVYGLLLTSGQQQAGGVTNHALTPNGVSSSSTVGTPALTQNHALAPASISSSPTVGTPALTQNHVLDPNDISSSPTVGTPVLSSGYGLTPDGVSSSPTVGTPAITQVHVLAPSGISSSPTVGSPALTQNHALAPSNISSSPTVGTPVLTETPAGALTPLGISSSPTVGTPALTQNHVLAPASISSSPTVGTPLLTSPEVEPEAPVVSAGGSGYEARRGKRRKRRIEPQQVEDWYERLAEDISDRVAHLKKTAPKALKPALEIEPNPEDLDTFLESTGRQLVALAAAADALEGAWKTKTKKLAKVVEDRREEALRIAEEDDEDEAVSILFAW